MSIGQQMRRDAAVAKIVYVEKEPSEDDQHTIEFLKNEIAFYKRRVEELKEATVDDELRKLKYRNSNYVKELYKMESERDRLAKHVRQLEEDLILHTDRVEYMRETNIFLSNEVETLTDRVKSLTQLAAKNQEVSPYLTTLFIQLWQTQNKDEECRICCELLEPTKFYLSGCGHYVCTDCRKKLEKCPECRHPWNFIEEPKPPSILDQIRNAPTLQPVTHNIRWETASPTTTMTITDAENGFVNYMVLSDNVYGSATSGITETTTFTDVDDVVDQSTRDLINYMISTLDSAARR